VRAVPYALATAGRLHADVGKVECRRSCACVRADKQLWDDSKDPAAHELHVRLQRKQ
jgi:hypothetical protein